MPCPSPGDLPGPGIESASLTSPALAGAFFTTSATWEAHSVDNPLPKGEPGRAIVHKVAKNRTQLTRLRTAQEATGLGGGNRHIDT